MHRLVLAFTLTLSVSALAADAGATPATGASATKATADAGTTKASKAGGKATAKLLDKDGKEVGTATFTESKKGVKVVVSVHDVSAGKHGFHIHAVGKCEAPDFKSAGGHFNPEGKQHGHHNPQGAHAGDLSNLTVGKNGKGTATQTDAGVTLGEGPTSLFGPDGTALVLHADPDDEKSDPAGNAGARIACGVITRE